MNIELLGSGIHFITAEALNRTIVSDGDALTLMDAGYPGNTDDIVASIREIGDHREASGNPRHARPCGPHRVGFPDPCRTIAFRVLTEISKTAGTRWCGGIESPTEAM